MKIGIAAAVLINAMVAFAAVLAYLPCPGGVKEW